MASARGGQKQGQTAYEMAVVERGSIENIVSSSGTLEPVGTVDVLAQMSGCVEQVFADYNDRVTRGQVLVTLNTDMLEVEERAAEAAVLKAQANRARMLLDYQNKQKLAARQLVSEYDLHEAKMNLQSAEADLASAQASLERIQTELNQYARLLSPIDGIVLARNVEPGQSVVEGSSSNSASLFTLATDLSRMEIKAKVDELDISSIAVGQEVRFTVEAYAGQSFSGSVREVRLVPETTDNLVTYTVIVDADNADGKLLPGMTADVEFVVQRKNGVLLVPNAALRFQPAGEAGQAASGNGARRVRGLGGLMLMPGPGDRPPGSGGRSVVSGPAGAGGANAASGSGASESRTVWVLDAGGRPAARQVRVGVTDGTRTEIIGADDLEGRRIIVRARVE